MPRIGSMMSMGKQAMQNSQTALQTTSHNIANVNTEGYTRQRVDLQTNEAIGEGRVRMGTGAKTVAVERIANNFVNKQIQDETTKMGYAAGKDSPMTRVEQVFNESINKGLNRFMGAFFNAFREFANNPESQATRALVKENAKQLTDDFHRINRQLKEIQREVDGQVTAQVGQINGYTREIASLNEKIQQIEVQGMSANDERDRRELLLKKMGEMVNIRWGEGDHGKLTVTAGNTGVLVSGGEFNELVARATPENEKKRSGAVDVFFKVGPNGSELAITNEIKGGQLGGALEARDVVVNDLHQKLDHMAFTVGNAVNMVHEQGYDRYNKTGNGFFDPIEQESEAAANIKLDDAVSKDAGRIAGALAPNSPGDNRVANAIASIEEHRLFKDGTATVDDFYNGVIGEFAVQKNRNTSILEHQKSIVEELKNVRESISGVSLDEETTDMVKFQKAFDASARLIRVADEMLETVINLKKM